MTANTGDDGDGGGLSLNQQYTECYRIYKSLQNSTESCNSDNYQSQVKKGIELAEQLTRAVSCASLFAANEIIDELPTSSLKFLLLPFLLAEFTGKLIPNGEERLEIINRVDVYYRDYLHRLTDYTLLDTDIVQQLPPQSPAHSASASQSASSEQKTLPEANCSTRPSIAELNTMSNQRETRIARYRHQRHLQEQLAEMESVVDSTCGSGGGSHVDDTSLRQYFIVLLRYCSTMAVDGVVSVAAEKPILQQMTVLRLRQSDDKASADTKQPNSTRPSSTAVAGSGSSRGPNSGAVLLTRSRLEAQVFGAGYTNLPTMSVEDFYRSRVADGTFMTPEQLAQTAREQAQNQKRLDMEHVTAEELQIEQKEEAVERDDPVELAKSRRWDEFRDECRRGQGNTYNRS